MPTGIRIKEIRRNKGLTQKQLGEKCHIAESTIRRYESGNLNPKIETLQKIAAALGCDLSELMDSEEYKLHNIEVAIKKANDAATEKPTTIAAHFDGDEYTDAELEEIKKFAEFVKSKRPSYWADMGKILKDINKPDAEE